MMVCDGGLAGGGKPAGVRTWMDSKFNGPIAAEVLARGKGRPGTHAEYEAYMDQGGSLDVLQDAARFDEAAMYELIGRYRRLPQAELEQPRAAGDPIADQISTQPDRGPQMDPAADARLAEAMWERRRTAICRRRRKRSRPRACAQGSGQKPR